jgi:ketosteroid isomerase-like protein
VKGVQVPITPLRPPASERRTLDERLFVRFPGLYRMIAPLLTSLPVGSRPRRWLVTRLIRRAYAAGNRRDFEVILVGNHPDHEYRPSRDLMPPDLQPVFRGDDEYPQLWRYWQDAFDDIRWDPEEILDLGSKILVRTHHSGHGSGSGLAVSEPVFQLFTLQRGLVFRQADFLDRAEAMEAAATG